MNMIDSVCADTIRDHGRNKLFKGESEEDAAKWAKEYGKELAIEDENVRRVIQQIKEIYRRVQHEKAEQDYKKTLEFEWELLEQKAEFEKEREKEKAENLERIYSKYHQSTSNFRDKSY